MVVTVFYQTTFTTCLLLALFSSGIFFADSQLINKMELNNTKDVVNYYRQLVPYFEKAQKAGTPLSLNELEVHYKKTEKCKTDWSDFSQEILQGVNK